MADDQPLVDRPALGGFLRARRDRLRPEDVGLAGDGRRRTPGLRREEVAVLAGVSVEYYTRLEKGRDRRPSPAVTRALADALQLGAEDRRHLHRLVVQSSPGWTERPGAGRRDDHPVLRPEVRAVLTALQPSPALVLSGSLDVVAWNDAMAAVLVGLADTPVNERNLVRLIVLDERFRPLWADPDRVTRDAVAFLRSALASRPGDPGLLSLLGELSSASREFARWWAVHDVKERCRGRKDLVHPIGGRIRLTHEMLSLPDDDQRVVVYLPSDEASAAALAVVTASPPESANGPGTRPNLRSVG
jgi:transcriptional regulator with XRE-family HTH domain